MFGIREPLPTPCDASASLAKVLSASPFQAQLGEPCRMPGSASLASLPAWPVDDRGLPGMTGDRHRARERRTKKKREKKMP